MIYFEEFETLDEMKLFCMDAKNYFAFENIQMKIEVISSYKIFYWLEDFKPVSIYE